MFRVGLWTQVHLFPKLMAFLFFSFFSSFFFFSFCLLSFLGRTPRIWGVSGYGFHRRFSVWPDPSHVCDLHHSPWQCRILNPLREARDRTCNLMVPSRLRFLCATVGTLAFLDKASFFSSKACPLIYWLLRGKWLNMCLFMP